MKVIGRLLGLNKNHHLAGMRVIKAINQQRHFIIIVNEAGLVQWIDNCIFNNFFYKDSFEFVKEDDENNVYLIKDEADDSDEWSALHFNSFAGDEKIKIYEPLKKVIV